MLRSQVSVAVQGTVRLARLKGTNCANGGPMFFAQLVSALSFTMRGVDKIRGPFLLSPLNGMKNFKSKAPARFLGSRHLRLESSLVCGA